MGAAGTMAGDWTKWTRQGGRVAAEGATDGERTYAVFQHLTLLTVGIIPLVAAIVMWRLKAKQSEFLDDHGREAVNFQISLLIYSLFAGILTVVLIGIPLMIAIFCLGVIGMILAAVAAGRGEYFRYPATIRLLH